MHPHGSSEELEIWVDRAIVPAGYGWSFPARDEVRIGVGSFDPRFHVKDPTVDLTRQLQRDAVRYQGNWIPHRLRPAVEDDVFFAGDSAGHCLPLTAEGIRTALYFGIALGRELREVVEGRATRETAAAPLRRLLGRARVEVPLDAARAARRSARAATALALASRAMATRRFTHWAFDHYLEVAPPSFVTAPRRVPEPVQQPAVAA